MELGEDSVDACEREFYEGTGIRVKVKRLLNVYTKDVSSYPNADMAQTVVILYEVEETEDYDITDFHNEETLEIAFFSQEEIA